MATTDVAPTEVKAADVESSDVEVVAQPQAWHVGDSLEWLDILADVALLVGGRGSNVAAPVGPTHMQDAIADVLGDGEDTGG